MKRKTVMVKLCHALVKSATPCALSTFDPTSSSALLSLLLLYICFACARLTLHMCIRSIYGGGWNENEAKVVWSCPT